jgi:NAD(P)-dependent dehydrogenase (short-subunit alcohol dehydrogenase family)
MADFPETGSLNKFRLDGKVALVTGAGRGGQARAIALDVTDSAAMRNVVAGLDRIDILVNNAGLNRPQPFLEVDEGTLDRLLALNVRAAFLVAQAAAQRMVSQGEGVIINMSSQMGHVGSERDRTVYVMTKHALEGLTKAMAVELAARGVRVVSIAPTFIDTPLVRPFFDDLTFRQWVLDRIPLLPPRRSRGGGKRGRVPGIARGEPHHRFEPARRRRLDRMVRRCGGAR